MLWVCICVVGDWWALCCEVMWSLHHLLPTLTQIIDIHTLVVLQHGRAPTHSTLAMCSLFTSRADLLKRSMPLATAPQTRAAALITQLPQVPGVELKKLLLSAMRTELRWASRRSCKDLELLFRADLEKDSGDWDKVGSTGCSPA